MKSNHQFNTLTAIAASLALFAGVAQADNVVGAPAKCSSSDSNMALCGKVGGNLYRCVQQKPCVSRQKERTRDERSAIWLLTELFFSQDR